MSPPPWIPFDGLAVATNFFALLSPLIEELVGTEIRQHSWQRGDELSDGESHRSFHCIHLVRGEAEDLSLRLAPLIELLVEVDQALCDALNALALCLKKRDWLTRSTETATAKPLAVKPGAMRSFESNGQN
jgi:hypothetical protein